MATSKATFHYCSVAVSIPTLFLLDSSFYSGCSVVRQITDHCGRPLFNISGDPIYETDHWATISHNWISYSFLTLALILSTYFLYLEFRAFFPKK